MELDYLLKNCRIIDGAGSRSRMGDIGITGDRFLLNGTSENSDPAALSVIDMNGRCACPGFIDIHSHADLSIYDPDQVRILEPLVRQGITTFVGGNCGMSMAPSGGPNAGLISDYIRTFTSREEEEIAEWNDFDSFCSFLEDRGTLLNAALLAPHALLRIDAMGLSTKTPGIDARRRMRSNLEACLEQGAIGMSCGLQYFPGLQASTAEIEELAAVVARAEGFLALHLRCYTDQVGKAAEEAIRIAERTGVRIQLSHLLWAPDLGRAAFLSKPLTAALSAIRRSTGARLPIDLPLRRVLSRLERLRESGRVSSGADVMPTTTGFTHLLALFPPWLLEGGSTSVLRRLSDSRVRERLRRSFSGKRARWPHQGDDWSLNIVRMLGWDALRVMSVASDRNRKYEGAPLTTLARERAADPLDAACDLLLEEDGRVLVFGSLSDPDDKLALDLIHAPLIDADTSIVTDTILLGFGKPSHLFYDCYPGYIEEFVTRRRAISLEAAVRKMTLLPAEQAGLRKRGRIDHGCFADLVIFDPERIRTRTTFQDPCHHPEGIDYVFINGRKLLSPDGFEPDPLPGRILRR